MNKFKKSLSIFMAATFILVGSLTSVKVIAAVASPVINPLVTPVINYVGVEHSPLVVGDSEAFAVTSAKYTGKVQYAEYLFNGSKYIKLQSYGVAIDSAAPYDLIRTPALTLGKHKVLIYVRKAGEVGAKYSKNGNFDSYYTVALNAVSKNNAIRINTTGSQNVETTGLTVKFNGMYNISGMTGPYLYKLFFMNTATGVWSNGPSAYSATAQYTLPTDGTYMVVAHVNTASSATYAKGGYEGWKTFWVKVTQ